MKYGVLLALDDSYAQEAADLLAGNGRNAASLREHTQLTTASNTETGMLTKLADGVMYSTIVYKEASLGMALLGNSGCCF